MRHFYLFLVLGILGLRPVGACAQDVILRGNGEEVPGRVLSISPTEIQYIPLADPPRKDTLRLTTNDVFLVRYANGTKEVLHNPTTPAAPSLSKSEAYTRGRTDAARLYKAPAAFWGTYAATLATAGYGGLASAVIITVSKPKASHFVPSEPQLLQNPDYLAGYSKQAQGRKAGSAWAGFGAGIATSVVVILVLVASVFR